MATITRAERSLRRVNGSECKIVAQAMFGAGLHQSIDVMVFRRESASEAWELCGDRPDPGVLGFFRPKTTIIAESPAIRGLQEGIAFSEVHIYTNFG